MLNIPSPMSGIRSPFGGRRWGPRTLFASADVGGIWDASVMSSLYQDSAGTTPVTAAGQPVGLMLDQRYGGALGPELVTNGTFEVGISGWVKGSGTTDPISWDGVGQRLKITNDLAYFASAQQTLTGLVVGTSYTVAVSVSGSTVLTRAQISTLAGATTLEIPIGAGTAMFVFVATATTHLLVLQNNQNTLGGVSYWDNITVHELKGNHYTQSVSASRPTYQVDGNGRKYLAFDGVDDGMLTGTITPAGGANKAQVFAGIRKLSDAAQGMVLEYSASIAANNGSFALAAPNSAAANLRWSGKGTVLSDADYTNAAVAAPMSGVLAGTTDISGDSAVLRRNGVQIAASVTDQGTGIFGTYPLYMGRRGGASLPFSGNMYAHIVRIASTNLTATQIATAEAWVNYRTGAY